MMVRNEKLMILRHGSSCTDEEVQMFRDIETSNIQNQYLSYSHESMSLDWTILKVLETNALSQVA